MLRVCALLLCFVPVPIFAASPDVEALVHQGIAYQETGHNRDAVTTLEQAVVLAEALKAK